MRHSSCPLCTYGPGRRPKHPSSTGQTSSGLVPPLHTQPWEWFTPNSHCASDLFHQHRCPGLLSRIPHYWPNPYSAPTVPASVPEPFPTLSLGQAQGCWTIPYWDLELFFQRSNEPSGISRVCPYGLGPMPLVWTPRNPPSLRWVHIPVTPWDQGLYPVHLSILNSLRRTWHKILLEKTNEEIKHVMD